MVYIRSNTITSVDAHGGELICTSCSFSTLLHPNWKARIQMSASFFFYSSSVASSFDNWVQDILTDTGPSLLPPAVQNRYIRLLIQKHGQPYWGISEDMEGVRKYISVGQMKEMKSNILFFVHPWGNFGNSER